MKIENLITVKNYADKTGVSTTWIYQLEKAGKIKVIQIDGIKFVVIK